MNEDDLDEFLTTLEDEEETATVPSRPPNRQIFPDTDDIDILLNDPTFDLDFTRSQNKPVKSRIEPKSKCPVVMIGKPGSAGKRCCTNIRCSKCDCAVVQFQGYAWAGEVEYLFLRNNYPDFSRLEPQLVGRRDSFAYACQCASVTARNQTSVDWSLKWFCASH